MMWVFGVRSEFVSTQDQEILGIPSPSGEDSSKKRLDEDSG